MHINDRAIVIYIKPLKENSRIISVLTQKYGLYYGVERIVKLQSRNPIIEGSLVDCSWQARLPSHLGYIKCELIKSFGSYILQNRIKLYAFDSIRCLIRKVFIERYPYRKFFEVFLKYLSLSKEKFSFANYIGLELEILASIGYKLTLDKCIITGTRSNLIFVSPKSGHAVCAEAGLPYAQKLLTLPKFLTTNTVINKEQKAQAFRLTSYFLNRYAFHCLANTQARENFIKYITS